MANTPTSATPPCHACEALLPDALDAVLSPADQTWFDAHLAACAACSEMVADAQRGAAWLELLKTPRPEPSPALLSRILAQTAGTPALVSQPWAIPAQSPAKVLPFRPHFFSPVARILETRLAMTAAMAFFSIAVTLNLTGVRLNQLHASDLRPSHLSNTWFQATAQAHRSYDNLRVVRVVAARMDSVRENLRTQPEEEAPVTTPQPSSRNQPVPRTQPLLLTHITFTHKQGRLA